MAPLPPNMPNGKTNGGHGVVPQPRTNGVGMLARALGHVSTLPWEDNQDTPSAVVVMSLPISEQAGQPVLPLVNGSAPTTASVTVSMPLVTPLPPLNASVMPRRGSAEDRKEAHYSPEEMEYRLRKGESFPVLSEPTLAANHIMETSSKHTELFPQTKPCDPPSHNPWL
uniref:Uncharacterized protein n=1 Tax=Ditylenchus dipsaci TaxID=166011 RepID=A0A915DPN5_9BILA